MCGAELVRPVSTVLEWRADGRLREQAPAGAIKTTRPAVRSGQGNRFVVDRALTGDPTVTVGCPDRYPSRVPRTRVYSYVGPADLRVGQSGVGAVGVTTPALLAEWLGRREPEELNELFTFVVALDGSLRLAARRSEHVALAGSDVVLAAGEMGFVPDGDGWRVAEVTNQSTGFCPDPDSWPAVAAALDRIGVAHPGGFTDKVTFRLCPQCGERNIVRDDDFTCALCDSALPARWNFAPGDHR